jgi:hypothetical protein
VRKNSDDENRIGEIVTMDGEERRADQATSELKSVSSGGIDKTQYLLLASDLTSDLSPDFLQSFFNSPYHYSIRLQRVYRARYLLKKSSTETRNTD